MTEWARRYSHHRKMIEIARRGQVKALRLRCNHLFDDLSRCTADELPFHVHRYDWTDLPEALADEEQMRR